MAAPNNLRHSVDDKSFLQLLNWYRNSSDNKNNFIFTFFYIVNIDTVIFSIICKVLNIFLSKLILLGWKISFREDKEITRWRWNCKSLSLLLVQISKYFWKVSTDHSFIKHLGLFKNILKNKKNQIAVIDIQLS